MSTLEQSPAEGVDDELRAQLVHLDELERRQSSRIAAGIDAELDADELPASQAAWPPGIPAPPDPSAAGSLAPYVAWLDLACSVLTTRMARNREELTRLASHWGHVLRHLDRLRPEEVQLVVEGLARVRERIAADDALRIVLADERRRLVAVESVRVADRDAPGAASAGRP